MTRRDRPLSRSAARTRTEFARRAFSVAAAHTVMKLTYRLTLDRVTLCTPFKTPQNTPVQTSLNLKPPAPPYPLQDFKALNKYCIIII